MEDGWPTSLKVAVPFWNGCNEDEHCIPNLVLDAKTDIPTAMEYCRRVLRKPRADCSAYTLSFDASIFVIESARRRVAVEATLENAGENAYNTVLNISFSRNLQFASLIQKDDLDINIECMSEEKHPNSRVCNVSYPFFRAKAKVAFRLDFEFSKSVFLQSLEIFLTTKSDSEEQESTKGDNSVLLKLPLKYESDLLFTRSSSQDYYEVKPNRSLERYDSIGPPFNGTFKLQNLGLFPVDGVAIKITVPVATRGGNRLLQLSGFRVHEGTTKCHIGGNNTDYRRAPSDEDLGRHPQLNRSNSDMISIDCSVNLAANGEVSFLLSGNLWMKSLRAMRFKSLRLVIHAALQRGFRSAFVFREEDPSRQIVFEISKVEDSQVPTWIIIGSTLGGLLLLGLLVLALWKLGFFKSADRKREADPGQSGKDLD
nr:PREDICTED: integrin alpha-11 [Anolis carolinensis]|eukprot:XP_008120479.1 PREDICTED: integrin alpha-11 [Anolis carolinensis]